MKPRTNAGTFCLLLICVCPLATAKADDAPVPPCRDIQPSRVRDPDKDSAISVVPAPIRAILEVAKHDGEKTNGVRNFGILAYNRDSLLSNDAFFEAAMSFYGELKEVDANHPSSRPKDEHGQLYFNGIQDQSDVDVWPLALKAAGNNPYVALRILLVYGHDDTANLLWSSQDNFCRLKQIDERWPPPESVLFRNGALGGLTYASEDVDEGRRIFAECNQDFLSKMEKWYCNDDKYNYLADYYHVIAGAFMGCRSTIRDRGSLSRFVLGESSEAATEALYLAEVRHYKIERFKDWLPYFKDDPSAARSGPLVAFGLDRIEWKKKPVLLPIGEMRSRIKAPFTDRDYRAAQAILHRFSFEVDFRQKQHRLGWEWANRRCSGLRDLELSCPAQ